MKLINMIIGICFVTCIASCKCSPSVSGDVESNTTDALVHEQNDVQDVGAPFAYVDETPDVETWTQTEPMVVVGDVVACVPEPPYDRCPVVPLTQLNDFYLTESVEVTVESLLKTDNDAN